MSSPKNIVLYFKEGASDKVYQAELEADGVGWLVNFAYGRRGSTMTTGTKTLVPIVYEKALAIFEKIVQEKKAKGYTEGEGGTPYQMTDKEQRVSGVLPQLLTFIDEVEVQRCVSADRYMMQEKKDGKRVLIQKEGSRVIGINRRGLTIGLPDPIVRAIAKLPVDNCLLDGERTEYTRAGRRRKITQTADYRRSFCQKQRSTFLCRNCVRHQRQGARNARAL